MSKKKKGKKRKLNKKKLFTFLFSFLLLFLLVYLIFNIRITNIYVKSNSYLTDQQIIDIAGISDYPKTINNLSIEIKKRLEENTYILSAKVYKKGILNKVYIEVSENYPLFYYQTESKTVLYNGDKVDENSAKTVVINHIPDTVYDKFLDKMKKINNNVLSRMSEIEYKPNDIEDERFFILMNDGNYVYITIDKFLTMNRYVDILKSFNNKKGILYLDSGEYFDVFD